ncbi:MAG: hypothetical protein ACF8OB_01900, partial [Phycisphaeraceae bacterium JB051]
WFKLFVGARSRYSDGKGSIAEYAAAAKRAGVGILYMTETFERFDPEQWDAYRQACADASDDELKVIAGLDIPDPYGNRYLLLNSPLFPPKFMLTEDGKAMVKTHYLCLTFPDGITIAHRASTSPLPEQLLKHFQGISVYTYRDGKMVDNSLSAFEWQLFRFSNPMPYAVHETYSPESLLKVAKLGHHVYAAAPTLADLNWYMGEHGTSHFWESPLPMQVTSGPMVQSFGSSPFLEIQSDQAITDVRLVENYNCYRRWTPNEKSLKVDRVTLPEAHVNWAYIHATDSKGNTVITAGKSFGKQIQHTWRCGDRQNWWVFPNIYTGCNVDQIQIELPTYWTNEASGGYLGFPNVHGPMRGENMAPILDFSYASPAAYIQDVFLDQRYCWGTFDDVIYDAKPSHATTRSRVFEGKVRYYQYFPEHCTSLTTAFPWLKQVNIALRRPIQTQADIFPVITTLDVKNAVVKGDMQYAYTDTQTGKQVTGRLTDGILDLPKGGRIGGLIALCDGLRVDARGRVGFATPENGGGALPVGYQWQGAFVTVAPEMADKWRNLMGFVGSRPYDLTVSQGTMDMSNMIVQAQAQQGGVSGEITRPLSPQSLKGLMVGQLINGPKYKVFELDEFRLPVQVDGINYNWPAAVVKQGKIEMPIDVFEGQAIARLDVMQPGSFYIGNTLLSDQSQLNLGIIKWDAAQLVCEVNNPTDQDLQAEIWTAGALKDHVQIRKQIQIKAGTSQTLTFH